MKHQYLATIIIPVFNAEKTLPMTMQSLLSQTMAQNDMEIILINDGSQDGSGVLCDKYAEDYTNVFAIHQSNGGVSSARNNGIRNARGKYLFFLDSDDAFSPETVENVVLFFEEHYDEIDVVTYPLTYIYESGKRNVHWRYKKILKKEQVWVLDEEPGCFISQTTMNICVKNRLEQVFDECIKYGEDQLFITNLLVKKNAIGFVLNANYLYFRPSNAAVYGSLKNSLSDVKYMFKELLALKGQYLHSRKYIDALLIYNCEWRIRGDYFYPYHLSDHEFQKTMDELRDIFDGIDAGVISRHPNCDTAYKYFMLSLKRLDRPKLIWGKSNVGIVGNQPEEILFYHTKIDVIIQQLKIKNNELYILGYIKGLETQLSNLRPQLKAIINDVNEIVEPIDLFSSQYSCYGTQMKTNEFHAFIFRKPIEKIRVLCFKIEYGHSSFNTTIWYNKRTSIESTIKRDFLIGEKYGLICSPVDIQVFQLEEIKLKKAVLKFENSIKRKSFKQWCIRKFLKVYAQSNKNVWLYMDSHDAVDNGYLQFEHDYPIKDGIKRYYIYPADHKSILPIDAMKKYGSNLVPFGCRKHKLLLTKAAKLLVAYVGRGSTIPFNVKDEQVYRDLLNYEVIYLQHGVMNAKLPNMYSKEKVYNIDKIVVSTNFEKENLLKLAYEERDILTCGMPRLDLFKKDEQGALKGRILFAPSWRKQLVTTKGNVQTPVRAFYESVYFKSYYKLLHDAKLELFLEQNNLYMDVQIHPMFSCYKDSFEIENLKRIRHAYFSNPSDYDCCITDFSSILFDYIYLKKPVISFFPDKEEFKGGSHTYREFSFPIEDGFMLVCGTVEEMIQSIKALYNNKMRLPGNIQAKADNLFFNHNSSHREAIYNALIKK